MQLLGASGQVPVQVRVDGDRWPATRPYPLPGRTGQQVVLEVGVLAAARDPHVAALEAVLELGDGAHLVVASVYASSVEDVALPAGLDEGGGSVVGHLPFSRRVHLPEHAYGFQQRLGRRCGGELEGLEQGRGVSPEAPVLDVQVLQVVEVRGQRQLLGLLDAPHEPLPAHGGLDGGVGIVAGLPRGDEGLAHGGVQAHLLVYGLAALPEVLVAGLLAFTEHLAHEPVVHVECFIGQGGRPLGKIGHERGVAVVRVEASEVLRGGLGPRVANGQDRAPKRGIPNSDLFSTFFQGYCALIQVASIAVSLVRTCNGRSPPGTGSGVDGVHRHGITNNYAESLHRYAPNSRKAATRAS
ncbi:MAG: hypothetical protein M3Q60_22960 [Actinomycetota bacterium]|nr:hypothetical protein [Actinomycetota bacterium]